MSTGMKAIKRERRERRLEDKRELWGGKERYERLVEWRGEMQGCGLVPLHLLSVCGVEVRLRAGTRAMKERAKTALGRNTLTLHTNVLSIYSSIA